MTGIFGQHRAISFLKLQAQPGREETRKISADPIAEPAPIFTRPFSGQRLPAGTSTAAVSRRVSNADTKARGVVIVRTRIAGRVVVIGGSSESRVVIVWPANIDVIGVARRIVIVAGSETQSDCGVSMPVIIIVARRIARTNADSVVSVGNVAEPCDIPAVTAVPIKICGSTVVADICAFGSAEVCALSISAVGCPPEGRTTILIVCSAGGAAADLASARTCDCTGALT